jgi:CRISPR/Cas system CMR-associated protein Cmr5 small subunit
MDKDTKLFFECTWGDKSHMNLFGKIMFSPLIILIGGLWITLDFLFSKREKNDNKESSRSKTPS